jgi:hypothetical protein
LCIGTAKARHAEVFNAGNVRVADVGFGRYCACPIDQPPKLRSMTRQLIALTAGNVGVARRLH